MYLLAAFIAPLQDKITDSLFPLHVAMERAWKVSSGFQITPQTQ
jgi:hypothetical protein